MTKAPFENLPIIEVFYRPPAKPAYIFSKIAKKWLKLNITEDFYRVLIKMPPNLDKFARFCVGNILREQKNHKIDKKYPKTYVFWMKILTFY